MDFWHTKVEIPESSKDRIKSMVKGQKVMTINPDDTAIGVLFVGGFIYERVFRENRKFLYRGDFAKQTDGNNYNFFNILTEDGLAGLSIDSKGWLQSVFSNEAWSGFIKLTADKVKPLVKQVVCIVGGDTDISPLVELYRDTYDLTVVAMTKDDKEFMTMTYDPHFVHGFEENWGKIHHVFLKKLKSDEAIEPKCFEEYNEALDYVNSLK